MRRIGIIGAGAWGTALALGCHRAGRAVRLWAHEDETARLIRDNGENALYLPGYPVPSDIAVSTDLAWVVDADLVLVVTPAQFVRETCAQAAEVWPAGVPAVVCAKGIERGSLKLMTEVLAETLPAETPIGVLSGPTFAAEVAASMPTAVTLAIGDTDLGDRMMRAIGTPTFRPYLSDDIIGAQVGGAVKNVLAIACGIVQGKDLGDNSRAALITRGLAEITRLSAAMGARQETLMGLSGLGDLILTANSMQSRNFSLGAALGQGRTLERIMDERRSVAEGVYSAEAVVAVATREGVDMPISRAVDAVLNHGADLDETIQGLLNRPFRTELDDA